MTQNGSVRVRHTLIASAMMFVIATAYGMPHVLGDDGTLGNVNEYGADRETAALEQIERFTHVALTTGEIPISSMLDRIGDRWISKYDSADDFEVINANTRLFINANLVGDDWNRGNAENHLRIYNFDTITGAVGDGHEITLLVSKLQKLQGRYNASVPVDKFHDWLATKYITPESEQKIVDRLVELLGAEKFLELAERAVKSFNELADNGSVPGELFLGDRDYWALVTNLRLCESTPSCDSSLLAKIVAGTVVTKLDDVEHVADAWDYVLPEVHAQTQIFYSLFGSAKASRCDYDSCYISAVKPSIRGPGLLSMRDYTPPDKSSAIHAERAPHNSPTTNIVFIASSCSMFELGIHNVELVPWLGHELRPERGFSDDSDRSEFCLVESKKIYVRTGWIYGFDVRSTGSYVE